MRWAAEWGCLGRRYGLACDNMLGARVVKADGSIVEADASNAPDLYWACRGGGGGSFGVVTRFKFKIHALSHVKTFSITWNFANTSAELAKARSVFSAWQSWAPNAPNDITAIMTVQRVAGNMLRLRCIGQTTASSGTNAALLAQLANLTSIAPPASGPAVVKRTFIGAVSAFAGGSEYETIYMDAKSDFVLIAAAQRRHQPAVRLHHELARRQCRGSVRRLWRGDFHAGGQRHGVCPPLGRGLFDPVLFALDERGGFGDARGAAETGV